MDFRLKVEGDPLLYWALRIFLPIVPIAAAYGLYLSFARESGNDTFLGWDLLLLARIALLYFMFQYAAVAVGWSKVEYTWEKFIVIRNGKKKEYKWSELKSVRKIVGASPPVYRVAFKNKNRPAYFSLSWKCGSIGIWSWDYTGFYDFARNWIDIEKEKQKNANQVETIGTSSAGPDSSS